MLDQTVKGATVVVACVASFCGGVVFCITAQAASRRRKQRLADEAIAAQYEADRLRAAGVEVPEAEVRASRMAQAQAKAKAAWDKVIREDTAREAAHKAAREDLQPAPAAVDEGPAPAPGSAIA
jgi:hypothetical protein